MEAFVVEARIENFREVLASQEGHIPPDQVAVVAVGNASVAGGVTTLCLPRRLALGLGLKRSRTMTTLTSGGPVGFGLLDPVRLTVSGRSCVVEPLEIADGSPVLIGVVPLVLLDLVVALDGTTLVPNPEHGPEAMYDLFPEVRFEESGVPEAAGGTS